MFNTLSHINMVKAIVAYFEPCLVYKTFHCLLLGRLQYAPACGNGKECGFINELLNMLEYHGHENHKTSALERL